MGFSALAIKLRDGRRRNLCFFSVITLGDAWLLAHRAADGEISPTPWRPKLTVRVRLPVPAMLRMRSVNMEGYKLEADQLPTVARQKRVAASGRELSNNQAASHTQFESGRQIQQSPTNARKKPA